MDSRLLFISHKLSHSKDIQCSPISSLIKNTMKFCYSKVNIADMDLIGIMTHGVRAFAASKVFYGEPNYSSLPLETYNTLPSFGCLPCKSAGYASFRSSSREVNGDAQWWEPPKQGVSEYSSSHHRMRFLPQLRELSFINFTGCEMPAPYFVTRSFVFPSFLENLSFIFSVFLTLLA